MVRTTKGPAEKSTTEKKPPAHDEPERMPKHADIDDATWGQIQSMARSQNSTPADVIRRAIENQYGAAPTTSAVHSGMDNDPAKS